MQIRVVWSRVFSIDRKETGGPRRALHTEDESLVDPINVFVIRREQASDVRYYFHVHMFNY